MEGMQQFRFVYLLGIGGIGMSAIARYFNADGKIVAGYDKTSTPLTDELRKEGMQIHFQDDLNLIPDAIRDIQNRDQVLVILTPAVPANHAELNFFTTNGYAVVKRSKVLGMLTADHFTLAVAGTHGKTTTSSILAHLLNEAGKNCTAFLGGISVNFGSNLLLGDSSKPEHLVVVEADEFDRSFLQLFPDMAIVTSMDADHLDIYGDANEMHATYQQFARQVKVNGFLLHKLGLNLGSVEAETKTYSITSNDADFVGTNIEIVDGAYQFDLVSSTYNIKNLKLGLPGRHNVENAVAASVLALKCGITEGNLRNALVSYAGAHRRFEVHIRKPNLVYIDDYAHHPEELKATILSTKELFPDKKITGIFQPHLYSRTRDFADGFAESLSLLDELYMIELYPAREVAIPGVNSTMILDKVTIENKKVVTLEELIQNLRNHHPQVLLTLGAGDIDMMVNPITQLFTNPWN